jgi:hypothetical protein
MNANTDIITNTFNHNNTTYRVTSFRGGNLEIYTDYIDTPGLEKFLGYASDVNMDLANAAYDAMRAAQGQPFLFNDCAR